MQSIATQLDQIAGGIIDNFKGKYQARDRALQHCRDIIRHSANAIRAIHRSDLPEAERLLAVAEGLLGQVEEALRDHPDVYFAGFVQDAQKEYAEAHITLAMVAGRPLPGPERLRVGYAAYLNGAGESVGELRREVLDRLRQRETHRCEELLAAMDDVYSILVTVDFPDAMTGNLRRTTDSARGILERTRGDLTMALVQESLAARLDRASSVLPGVHEP